MVVPPSLPLNIISLFCTDEYNARLELSLLNLPYSTPALNNLISLPAASKVISPTVSIVKSPLPLSVSVVALLPSPDIDTVPSISTPPVVTFKRLVPPTVTLKSSPPPKPKLVFPSPV